MNKFYRTKKLQEHYYHNIIKKKKHIEQNQTINIYVKSINNKIVLLINEND